ncbi:MAG TPA: neutral/alkaline non-lysosomal ceramidase N-terminal domain-containing protein [Bacteroidales bacterium]|nr:neutral/alkaline non-lysosomal ceramidase N-terminal domain-containing protein [Bacteroidales bacterium]
MAIFIDILRKQSRCVIMILLVLATGCAVVKKPYVTSSYYHKTTEELYKANEKTITNTGGFKAGFSKVNLVPGEKVFEGKIPIAGFGQLKTKYSTGIHDSIYVRAVALSTGTDTLVIVSADMLIMPPDIADTVIKILSGSRIKRRQIFFSATHTHSGIGGWGHGKLAKLMAGKPDKKLKQYFSERIVFAIETAISDIKPARLGSGSFHEPGFIRNRLTGESSTINDAFDYLVIEQPGSRRCILGTYSAHATTIGSKNTLLSGDYPGMWSEAMEHDFADLALFCGGSMGGQAPVSPGEIYEGAEIIGKSLADSILNGVKEINLNDQVVVNSISLPLSLPKYRMRISKNRSLPTFVSKSLMASPKNVFLQALRINNMIWFFTPCDFNGEYALMLKRLYSGKGYNVAVSGYNGSYIGYIIPGKYYFIDHSEARTMSWFGPSMGEYMFEMMDRMAGKLIDY